MSQYSFAISDYHSIRQADIRLDGISVVAGCNGSGKSTIARWIYAFVNYANDFPALVDRQLVTKLHNMMYVMFRILRNLDGVDLSMLRKFRHFKEEHGCDVETDYFALYDEVESMVHYFCDYLSLAMSDESRETFGAWLLAALKLDEKDLSDVELLKTFYTKSMEKVKDAFSEATAAKAAMNTSDLLRFIRSDMDFVDDFPRHIAFFENGHNLISGERFNIPIGLRNAVYVDTPMALSTSFSADNKIWGKMMEALTTPLAPMPESASKLAARIRRIIGGDIKLKKDDFSKNFDIRYVRKNDMLDISVNEAATGLKTFAYMLRLLENGYLTGESILLIDEPEAHLHPQWIVEFARILVLLHKEVGTTVLIASHNPDMVAAVKAISAAEGVENATSFYQAVADDDAMRYGYEYLGSDIERIFSSFNIAMDRIKDYGC